MTSWGPIPCRHFNFQIRIRVPQPSPEEIQGGLHPRPLTTAAVDENLMRAGEGGGERKEMGVGGARSPQVCVRSLGGQARVGRERTLALTTVCHFEPCGSLF